MPNTPNLLLGAGAALLAFTHEKVRQTMGTLWEQGAELADPMQAQIDRLARDMRSMKGENTIVIADRSSGSANLWVVGLVTVGGFVCVVKFRGVPDWFPASAGAVRSQVESLQGILTSMKEGLGQQLGLFQNKQEKHNQWAKENAQMVTDNLSEIQTTGLSIDAKLKAIGRIIANAVPGEDAKTLKVLCEDDPNQKPYQLTPPPAYPQIQYDRITEVPDSSNGGIHKPVPNKLIKSNKKGSSKRSSSRSTSPSSPTETANGGYSDGPRNNGWFDWIPTFPKI